MLFGKKTHPANFAYASTCCVHDQSVVVAGECVSTWISCAEIDDYCIQLKFDNSQVIDKRNYSDAIVPRYRQGLPIQPRCKDKAVFAARAGTVEIAPSKLSVYMASGFLLETVAEGVGTHGEKFILNFAVEGVTGYYGFGERTKRLNKRGDSMDFWNVDVVAVFPHTYDRDDYDPTYVAVPLAIIKRGDNYMGIYFDNPGRSLIDVEKIHKNQLIYQSQAGNTDVYFIDGPTLRHVVRRFSQLTGRAKLPPLWSLGYHQSRWGYPTQAEFLALKETFKRHDIPVSALWYDIDYMDGYRLFTWDRDNFPAPSELNKALKAEGIYTVVIIDPGVKKEPGYAVYESGNGYFCKTAHGKDYVGRVWPGDTVFPDFTQVAAQDWWADQVAGFVQRSGVDGVWLDMNDPATGYSDPDDMRFAHGAVPHDRYHNQYGHYMAKASHKALTKVDPHGRPFLLTRSGYTGTQRYSAAWTGDNVSNWQHLRMAIPASLNLGLSGIAFTGPDVGGFMGHTTAELLIRWYQTCFLFPFFRNHSVWDCKPQEPWQFGPQALSYIRATIQTRYRLLPYLYTCFFNHYLTGDPVLQPLLYHYDESGFETLDDQFLVGNSLMVAPILTSESHLSEMTNMGKQGQVRHIALPQGWWFDLNQGEWLAGGTVIRYGAALSEVPLFVKDGTIIPYYNGQLTNGLIELNPIELHIFSKERAGECVYYVDDQKTNAYQDDVYNSAHIKAVVEPSGVYVHIVEKGKLKTGSVTFTAVLYGYGDSHNAVVSYNGNSQDVVLTRAYRSWICKNLPVLASGINTTVNFI